MTLSLPPDVVLQTKKKSKTKDQLKSKPRVVCESTHERLLGEHLPMMELLSHTQKILCSNVVPKCYEYFIRCLWFMFVINFQSYNLFCSQHYSDCEALDWGGWKITELWRKVITCSRTFSWCTDPWHSHTSCRLGLHIELSFPLIRSYRPIGTAFKFSQAPFREWLYVQPLLVL